jgi:hypothetical protein
LGAAPPTEGKPSVLPNIIFGLIKPSYLVLGLIPLGLAFIGSESWFDQLIRVLPI